MGGVYQQRWCNIFIPKKWFRPKKTIMSSWDFQGSPRSPRSMWKSPGGWWGDGTHFNFGCLAFRGELRSNLELDKEKRMWGDSCHSCLWMVSHHHGHLNNWGVDIQGYVMHIDEIPPITGPEKLLGSGCGCDLRLGILPTYWDAPSMKIPRQWTQKGTDPILGDRFERIWY